MFSLSVFALEDGHQFTFKDEYTFDDLLNIYRHIGDTALLNNFSNHPFTTFSDNDSVRFILYNNGHIFKATFAIGVVKSDVAISLFLLKDGVYYTVISENGNNFATQGQTVKFDYNEILEYNSSYTLKWNDADFNTYFPEYKEPLTFVTATTSGISHIIGWISTVISSFVLENGSLRSLLTLFVIPISISAIFFGIKVIKNVIWGT